MHWLRFLTVAWEGDPMNGIRSSSAALSPAEVNSLRRVASGLANYLPSAHRRLLTAMRLVAVTGGGRLVLTQEGKQRLAQEENGGSASDGAVRTTKRVESGVTPA